MENLIILKKYLFKKVYPFFATATVIHLAVLSNFLAINVILK